ncbi:MULTISPECIES: relaxase/mobilization nuclease domain-containing protein [unclassified Roseovarius]|uniref:relaxase/mobilization nuclease domain-containing protein n=1 Tax=unclassified Roseovarius TaxID=2614913 RepID=UPI00125F3BBF|nr:MULTISPECIES: hypothetical protein [unclassified Roseovarius]
MRPYLNWHGDPDKLNRYINKADAEPIGGTIPNFGSRDLFQRFRALMVDDPRPEPVLHMTLSLPKSVRVTRSTWLKIIKAGMKVIGLDPEMTPWFSKRHRDTDCDHVHTAIVLRDFAGRLVNVSGSEKKAEDAHRYLCEMLGLPAPEYFDETAPPRLDPITPKRRLQEANHAALHCDLQNIFRERQPATLSDLNDALATQAGGFQVEMVANRHDVPAFKFTNSEGAIFGGLLGKAWEPRHLQKRLQFTDKLRRLRDRIDLDQLLQIFKTPIMETIVANIINRQDAPRTSCEPADHSGSDKYDGPARPRSARPAGSFGSTGQPTGIAGRADRQLAERPVGSSGTVSGGTDQAVRPDGKHGETDHGRNADHAREPAEAKCEARPDPQVIESASGLTVGMLLGRVCRVAAERKPGWRVKFLAKSMRVAVKFADRSGVVIDQQATKITQDGEEARKFEAAYMAVVVSPDNDWEKEKEKDAEEDVGFTPEF